MDGLIDIGLNLMHKSFNKDREDILANANAVGVSQFIVTGSSVESSRAAIKYINESDLTGLYSTAGVHPHDAKTCDRNYSPPDVQREWFEKQVALALELDMPLFLHEREAHEDLVEILSKYPEMCSKAVVHCFTGTKEEAQDYIDLGCHIGVTGWICDERRGQSLQEAVSVIPPERLMIETDAPFLIPRDFEKKPKSNKNKPEYLPHILEVIASYKECSSEELAIDVSKTTRKFFNI